MTPPNITAATMKLDITILPDAVMARCKQCGKPARTRVATDTFSGYLCSVHTQLAIHHYVETHRLG